MTLLKEVEVNTLLERTILEKRKYKPRSKKILPITKGKTKGPKYTFDDLTFYGEIYKDYLDKVRWKQNGA